jgi:hypothetical protein
MQPRPKLGLLGLGHVDKPDLGGRGAHRRDGLADLFAERSRGGMTGGENGDDDLGAGLGCHYRTQDFKLTEAVEEPGVDDSSDGLV